MCEPCDSPIAPEYDPAFHPCNEEYNPCCGQANGCNPCNPCPEGCPDNGCCPTAFSLCSHPAAPCISPFGPSAQPCGTLTGYCGGGPCGSREVPCAGFPPNSPCDPLYPSCGPCNPCIPQTSCNPCGTNSCNPCGTNSCCLPAKRCIKGEFRQSRKFPATCCDSLKRNGLQQDCPIDDCCPRPCAITAPQSKCPPVKGVPPTMRLRY